MALVNEDSDVREEILRAGFTAIDADGNGIDLVKQSTTSYVLL